MQTQYKVLEENDEVFYELEDSEKGPIAKRPNPPGHHGPTKSRRQSEFAIRLKEKQKVRFHYGLKEKQVRVIRVPGAFEIPLMCKKVIDSCSTSVIRKKMLSDDSYSV